MAEIEKTAEVKEVAPIVPMVVTIASAQDVVKVVGILDGLVKKDAETRGKEGVTETGKALLKMHEVTPLPATLIDEAFKQGNITFSHQPQIRADYASVFNTLYAYVLSKNVPELSGLVASSSKRSKGDGTPSDYTFAAMLSKDNTLSVEKILEAKMKDAKGTLIDRASWKYIGYVNGTATCSCKKPDGLWEKVTGQYPNSVSDKMKLHIGVLGEGRK